MCHQRTLQRFGWNGPRLLLAMSTLALLLAVGCGTEQSPQTSDNGADEPAESENAPSSATNDDDRSQSEPVKVAPADSNPATATPAGTPNSDAKVLAAYRKLGAVEKRDVLGQLVGLELGGPQVKDSALEDLVKIPGLQQLTLQNTGITDKGLPAVARVEGLTSLNLYSTAVTNDGVRHLQRLRNLKQLDLRATFVSVSSSQTLRNALPNCQILISDDPLVAALKDDPGNLPAALKRIGGQVESDESGEIVGVDLRFKRITNAGLVPLKTLTGLKRLNLYNTEVTDAGLSLLPTFAKLRWLNLGSEVSTLRITDAGLAQLPSMTSLLELNLGNTDIGDAGLVHLAGLTGLVRLGLSGTNVRGPGLQHLRPLAQLKWLNLVNTPLDDAGTQQLRLLTGLEWLNVSNTKISDTGMASLNRLSSLKALAIANTGTTDSGLAQLNLAKLEALGLEGTRITDAAKTAFRQRAPQCRLLGVLPSGPPSQATASKTDPPPRGKDAEFQIIGLAHHRVAVARVGTRKLFAFALCQDCWKSIPFSRVKGLHGGFQLTAATAAKSKDAPVTLNGSGFLETDDLSELSKAVREAKTPHPERLGLVLVVYADINKKEATAALRALGKLAGVDAKRSKAEYRSDQIFIRLTGREKVTLAGILTAFEKAGINASLTKSK